MIVAKDILDFWFGDLGDGTVVPVQSKMWFAGGERVDAQISLKFGDTLKDAQRGGLRDWEESLSDRLGLVVLLDQFSRHIFRGTAEAFSQDPRALSLVLSTLDKKDDLKLKTLERTFLYLPLEHSEDVEMQKLSVACYTRLAKDCPETLREYVSDNLRYAIRHKEIIERFGRFPHRNSILNRASTKEEVQFLKEPMSSF